VSVTLNGFSHAFPADVDLLLVSPSGRKSVIMSDFGAGSPGVSGINVTLDDYADRPVPSTVTGNTGVPFVTGTYRPANSGTTDVFPAPAPAAPYTYTLSAFNGDNPNGTWNLFIIDDANLDGGSVSGGWTLTFDTRPPPPAAGDILVSEFRTRGAGTTPPGSDGSADEFIELYNNTDASITIIDAVAGADPTSSTGAGWRIAGAQGATETTFLVLPQTLSTAGPIALPPRGYFLISTQPTTPSPAGNTYSLSTYPTGTGITASGSANVSVNPVSATVGFLPDDVGLAIFSTAAANSANRLDSVGYSSVTNPDYKEGAGLAPAAGITTAGQHSWVRREAGGFPQDTGNNSADFVLVDTTGGTLNGIAATLGAPGPERGPTMTAFTSTSAPLHTATGMTSSVIDPAQAANAAPNLVTDPTPVTNGANGTIKIRRKYTNTSGAAFVALRFRVAAISTLTGGAVPVGFGDMRVLNSPAQTITLTDTSTITSQALTLQTPAAQALGGGLNSSLAEGVITPTALLANGADTYVEFNLGVQTAGPYSVTILAEGLIQGVIGGASAVDTFTSIVNADLSITKTDGVTSATPGGSVTYTITASNAGPSNAAGATVADTFPAPLTCTWTCVGAGGGTCTASGSGNINDTVNLPAGGSTTYTASCAISASATGTLANTATVTAPAGVTDPTPGNNSATDTDTLTPQADLSITKTDGVTSATPGGSVTYTITASNAGPSNATGATVADTFPAALTCTWTCVGAGGGTCTASGSGNINGTVNLPAGGSTTYTAACAISASATGTLSNTATVTAPAGVTDPTPGNNSATDTDTLSAQADLSITKTDGVTSATPGGSATYTITASNAGPSNATGATVADTFPAALTCTWTCVGAGGGTCTASGSGNINGTVNLPAGGSTTYTASCAISASATGTLSNTATVTAPAGVTDPTPGNNSATDTDTLSAQADLSITKTDGVTSATPGGSVTYTIVASNAGPSNATGATVADTFPAALTCTWTCVGAGGGTCTASGSGNINGTVNLPAGGSTTYTATCAISASATGTLANTATVTAPAGVTDPTPGNNSATDTDTLGASADLSITKTDGVTSTTPGGTLVYTIVASNAGPSNATGATVADTFPAALTCTWICAGTSGGTCTASGSGNINDTVNLPSAGSVTYTASCTVAASAANASVISNTASISAAAGVTDPTPGNNTATDTTTVSAIADLSITKTDGVTNVAAGGTLTYAIVTSNAGPQAATGATVTDTFPAALSCTWTCAGTGGGTCSASGTGNIGDVVNLPSGASVTHTAVCIVAPATPGGSLITNTATVTAPATVSDPSATNNTATDETTVVAGAGVSGTKAVSGTLAPGGTISYTIVLSNAGPGSQADNPGDEFVDTLPTAINFTSVTASSGTATYDAVSRTVRWNGAIAAGASVTITISAVLDTEARGRVNNQGTIHFDSDGDGTNESSALTDDAALPGANDPTGFIIATAVPALDVFGLLLLMFGLVLVRLRHARR
jgi:uncharacterized repeat protein (TIGR01451 family)